VIPARTRVAHSLGLERDLIAVSGPMFLLALGENLWKRFLPKYLPRSAGRSGSPCNRS